MVDQPRGQQQVVWRFVGGFRGTAVVAVARDGIEQLAGQLLLGVHVGRVDDRRCLQRGVKGVGASSRGGGVGGGGPWA